MSTTILKGGKYFFEIINCDVDYVSKNSGSVSIRLIFEIPTTIETVKIYKWFTKKLDPKTNKPYEFIIRSINELLNSIEKPHLIGKKLENSDLLGGKGFATIQIIKSEQWGEQNDITKFLPPTDTTPMAEDALAAEDKPDQENIFDDKDLPF